MRNLLLSLLEPGQHVTFDEASKALNIGRHRDLVLWPTSPACLPESRKSRLGGCGLRLNRQSEPLTAASNGAELADYLEQIRPEAPAAAQIYPAAIRWYYRRAGRRLWQ